MSWLKNKLESVAAKGKSIAGAVADGTLKKIGSILGPGAAPAVRIDATVDLIKDFQAAVSGVGADRCDAIMQEYVARNQPATIHHR
jgi:hypothetical protein